MQLKIHNAKDYSNKKITITLHRNGLMLLNKEAANRIDIKKYETLTVASEEPFNGTIYLWKCEDGEGFKLRGYAGGLCCSLGRVIKKISIVFAAKKSIKYDLSTAEYNGKTIFKLTPRSV